MRHAMVRVLGAFLLGSLLGHSAYAVTVPEITVTPWLAPNVFGSPSWAAAEANAVQAMYTNASTYGAAGPSQFNAQTTSVTSDQVIVTGFPSWMGQVDPGVAFGAAYIAELGNRMTFALKIDGKGSQFSISQLAFSATSTDPFNALAFGFGAGGYNYGSGYWGVLYGTDGQMGGGDDTFITAGPNTQLVDGLIGRGSGNSFAAYCSGCDLTAQEAALLAVAAYPGTPFKFTGTYTLTGFTGVSGSGTFNIDPVPIPAALPLLASAIGGFGVMAYRRRKKHHPPANT